MGSTIFRGIISVVALLGAGLHAGACMAQADWPSRPVRLIVGYPPGGGADTVARLLAERLSKSLGQSVIVDNRAGASGAIGASAVARAEPDGYLLLVAASSEISVAPATVKSLPYEPLRDFKPIAQLARWPFILATSAGSGTASLAELIAYAKANPGKLSYSSFGNNSMNHLIGEDFKLKAGISAVHIPYKGSGTPEEFALAIQSEIAAWRQIGPRVGITPE